MLESKTQSKIKSTLKKKGWIVEKFDPGTNGWPDLIYLKQTLVFFIETKQVGKRLRPLQIARKDQLIRQGFHVFRADKNTDINKILQIVTNEL